MPGLGSENWVCRKSSFREEPFSAARCIEAPHTLPPSHGCMMQIADVAPSVVPASFHEVFAED